MSMTFEQLMEVAAAKNEEERQGMVRKIAEGCDDAEEETKTHPPSTLSSSQPPLHIYLAQCPLYSYPLPTEAGEVSATNQHPVNFTPQLPSDSSAPFKHNLPITALPSPPSHASLHALLSDLALPSFLSSSPLPTSPPTPLSFHVSSINLWLSLGQRTSSNLHYDALHNLLVCIRGRKRVRLFNPDRVRQIDVGVTDGAGVGTGDNAQQERRGTPPVTSSTHLQLDSGLELHHIVDESPNHSSLDTRRLHEAYIGREARGDHSVSLQPTRKKRRKDDTGATSTYRDNTSISSIAIEEHRFPSVPDFECVLEPLEMLFLPAGWLHQVDSFGEEVGDDDLADDERSNSPLTIAVNIWFSAQVHLHPHNNAQPTSDPSSSLPLTPLPSPSLAFRFRRDALQLLEEFQTKELWPNVQRLARQVYPNLNSGQRASRDGDEMVQQLLRTFGELQSQPCPRLSNDFSVISHPCPMSLFLHLLVKPPSRFAETMSRGLEHDESRQHIRQFLEQLVGTTSSSSSSSNPACTEEETMQGFKRRKVEKKVNSDDKFCHSLTHASMPLNQRRCHLCVLSCVRLLDMNDELEASVDEELATSPSPSHASAHPATAPPLSASLFSLLPDSDAAIQSLLLRARRARLVVWRVLLWKLGMGTNEEDLFG